MCAGIAEDGGACGCVVGEKLGVGVVEVRKERAVFEDDGYFQDVVERCSRVFEYARDIGENAPGLRFDIVSDNFIGFRIDRGLSRDEDEVAVDYGLGVGEFGDVPVCWGRVVFSLDLLVKNLRMCKYNSL